MLVHIAPGEMKFLRLTIITILTLHFGSVSTLASQQSTTYRETIDLLREMERDAGNKALKKLFEHGENRLTDLKQALYESDRKIQLNAQIVLQYLGIQSGIDAINTWIEYRRSQRQDYWTPKGIENFTGQNGKTLIGKDKDLEKLVAKNAYFMPRINQREISARVIAYNPARNKALVEVTHDCVPLCGEGWLVTVLNENGVWRYIVVGMTWVS